MFARETRSAAKRRGALTVAVLCVTAVLAGCAPKEVPTDDPSIGAGPLVTAFQDGGTSVLPPREVHGVWRATFGSLLICAPVQVTITGVKPHYKVGKPVNAQFWVRTVPGTQDRPDPQGMWSPLGSDTRTPAELARRGQLASKSLVAAQGAQVDQRCDESPDAPFTEILTVLSANDAGVWVDRMDVEYEADGQDRAMRVNWSYVACGYLIDDPEVC